MKVDYSLTVLGSSSATPTENRHHSAFILKFAGHKFMIDCGEGTQNRCLQYDINFQRIETIFISHLHGDHYLGLPGLINTMNLYSRKKELTVYGLKGIRELLETNFRISQVELRFELNIIELEVERKLIYESESTRVYSFPLEHRIPCIGFRFEEKTSQRRLNTDACDHYLVSVDWYSRLKEGEDYCDASGTLFPNRLFTFEPTDPHRYVHISDTRPNAQLKADILEADLMYHEATFLDNLSDRAHETFHSTALQAAKVAKGAEAHQLIIGHFSSRYKELTAHLQEAQTIFKPTMLAIEGQIFPLR